MNYLDANPIRIPPGVTPEEAKERFKPFPNHLDAAGADSCIVHAGMAAAFGFPLGMGFAFLFNNTEIYKEEYRTSGKMWRQVWDGTKTVAKRGWSNGKNFATLGILWSGTECILEKQRGKTDMYNNLIAGAFTGTLLAFRGGIYAILTGSAGMIGFSLLMSAMMGQFSHRPQHSGF